MSARHQRKRFQDQIADELRSQISTGELKPGAHLLSERKLAAQYGVSTRIVRESLARLEAEGLISREHGRGTLVRGMVQTEGFSRRQSNIALFFIGRIRDTSTMEYFEAFQSAFQRGGFGTVVYTSDNDPQEETRLVNQLVRDGIAGLVLFSAHISDSHAHLEAAQQAGVPVAVFDHDFPGLHCNYVGIDELDAAYRATLHLVRLGCDDLIYIDSDHPWTSVQNRRKGFQEMIQKHAPALRGRLLKVSPFDRVAEQINEGLPALLADRQGRLGVVAYNDAAALYAIDCMKDCGLSVSEDASVIGFADDLDGAISGMPLTTMQIPRGEIARSAAYLLMHQIRNPEHKPQKVHMTANLLIRDSCGCYLAAEKHRAALS